MTITRTGNKITIEVADDWTADQLEAALKSRQWVQLKGANVRLARAEAEPEVSDDDKLITGKVAPCFRDAAAPEYRCERKPSDRDGGWEACYVHHLCAGSRTTTYAQAYHRMKSVGFHLLRSPWSTDTYDKKPRYWEIWYLPSLRSLKGEMTGKNREELTRWLFDQVTPGNVVFDGETWSLSVD